MNALIRSHISEYSNEDLESNIDSYYKKWSNTGRNLRQVRASINRKLQALIDEKQKRLLIAAGIA